MKKNQKLEERRKTLPTKEDVTASAIKEAKRIYGVFYMTCAEYTEEIQCSLQAKQCGYILCNNIIFLSKKRSTKNSISAVDVLIIDYYEEVKKHIENL
jgi:hypothetical protein